MHKESFKCLIKLNDAIQWFLWGQLKLHVIGTFAQAAPVSRNEAIFSIC